MKQVIEELRTGKLKIVETPVPKCGAGEVLVRNAFSLVSPGTEKSLIEMGKKSIAGKALARPDLVSLAYQKAKREGFFNVFREALARLDQPMPLGYSSAGRVVKVGPKVKDLRPGDLVACAGSNFANHAEFVSVPRDLVVKLPSGKKGADVATLEGASFVMLGGIAMQGIRSAQLTAGERVAVIGLGLIGLLTVQIAKAQGCFVIGVDVDSGKVHQAEKSGCDRALTVGTDDVELAVSNLTDGEGVDAVLITAAADDNKPILLSEAITRRRGRIVLVGVAEILLTRKMFWEKELSFTVSKASGPSAEEYKMHSDFPAGLVRWTERRNLEEFLRLASAGLVNVHDLITHRFTIENAIEAYDLILSGKERYIGVLITYPASANVGDVKVIREIGEAKKDVLGKGLHVGIIGAGMFTKNILLPALKKINGVALEGISAKTGLSARHLAETFDFRYSTSEYNEILADPEVGSVIITTRHNLHGAMVKEALLAAKNVFVEKPLCIREDELLSLMKEFTAGKFPAMFMVGFNRNYSPLSISLFDMLRKRTSPLIAHYRVNAGFIPRDHWTQDPSVGGGRIIGEVCHFVEYLRFLSGAEPTEVFAESIGGRTGKYSREDNISVSIRFSDGSLGTILYTALGSKVFSRERVEVFSDESVYVLEDFRSLEIIKGSRKDRRRLWNQNMGYVEELRAFLHGGPDDGFKNFLHAAISTKATFAIVESLRTHSPITIT